MTASQREQRVQGVGVDGMDVMMVVRVMRVPSRCGGAGSCDGDGPVQGQPRSCTVLCCCWGGGWSLVVAWARRRPSRHQPVNVDAAVSVR